MRPGVAQVGLYAVVRTLTEDRRKPVVVRVDVILNTANAAEELIGPAAIDASRTGRRCVVEEVAVKMQPVRAQILGPQLRRPATDRGQGIGSTGRAFVLEGMD